MRLLFHLCSRLPFGAPEVRTRGLAETDESDLHATLKSTTVNGNVCTAAGAPRSVLSEPSL